MFDASFGILTALPDTKFRQLEIRPLKICQGRIDSETGRICRPSEIHQQANEKLLFKSTKLLISVYARERFLISAATSERATMSKVAAREGLTNVPQNTHCIARIMSFQRSSPGV
jgi:hypothetical protein